MTTSLFERWSPTATGNYLFHDVAIWHPERYASELAQELAHPSLAQMASERGYERFHFTPGTRSQADPPRRLD